MFWNKKPKIYTDEEQEKLRKADLIGSVTPAPDQPVEAYPVPDKSSVDARIDEALEKLISKIKEKHFSPEVQSVLKEMQEQFWSYIYITFNNRFGTPKESITIGANDISLSYGTSLYNYKDKSIRERLITKIGKYDYDYDIGIFKISSEKPFINHIYDYFFNGELEKDIENKREQNREYKERKEAEKFQVADELCAKLKDLNIS